MGAVSPVATILPVLSSVGSAIGILNTGVNFLNKVTGADQKQAQARQRIEQQQAQDKINLQQQQLSLSAQNSEENRIRSLRNSIARQRAKFGSGGTGSSGGSADAVLLGLFNESDEERLQRERMDSLRNQVLQSQSNYLNSRNLLRDTQLAERQNLERYYLSD